MQDLNLYLDLNPNDSKMIELYNYYLKQYKDFMNVYQNKYGPIVLECDALKGNRWDWINSPWPWEVNK
jgi:spore coat protein JB